jgi:hypothetical protein
VKAGDKMKIKTMKELKEWRGHLSDYRGDNLECPTCGGIHFKIQNNAHCITVYCLNCDTFIDDYVSTSSISVPDQQIEHFRD